MVDAMRASTATPRAAPLSRDAAQPEPQADTEHARRFNAALARHKDGKGKSGASDGSDAPRDIAAALALPTDPTPASMPPAKQDKRESPELGMTSTTPHAAERQDAGSPALSASPDFAGPALAAQFAARLELPQTTLAQSQLFLDERQYVVSNVVIASEPGAGLSISYDSSSDADPGNPEADDSLRRRLEARGLKVSAIGPGSRQ